MPRKERRVGGKPADFSRQDLTSIKLDSGPYIGIVKNNLDPIRKGRLQVYIPDLGGDPNEPTNWRTVGYASPYMGGTGLFNLNTGTLASEKPSEENLFDRVDHTYGMWMVPPDVNNQVLVTFVAGDPNRGYWFACILQNSSHGMVPGLSSTDKWSDPGELESKTLAKNNYPALEFNEHNENLRRPGYLNNNQRPLHRRQFERLVQQGLENDSVRGTHTSSSQREAPSGVFGISTPGRPDPDFKNNPELLEKFVKGEATTQELEIRARQGGHTFVMDDGDFNGNDQAMRLRTAGGHQIVMHDSDQTMYISNSNGSVWIELSNSGHLHIFSSNGINVRSQGDINLHSDQDINMQAGGDVNIKARYALRSEATQTDLSASAGTRIVSSTVDLAAPNQIRIQSSEPGSVFINSGPPITPPPEIVVKKHGDTKKTPNDTWGFQPDTLTSIATAVPTHEPWNRRAGVPVNSQTSSAGVTDFQSSAASANQTGRSLTGQSSGGARRLQGGEDLTKEPTNEPTISSLECQAATLRYSNGVVVDGQGVPVGTGSERLDPGPSGAQGRAIKSRLPLERLSQQPTPPGGIGPLSVSDVRAVMAQLGWRESNWNYSAENQIGYLGKYQFGAAALVDRGYIRRDFYSRLGQAALNNPNAWTNKNNIASKSAWLLSPQIQELTMYEQLQANYSQLLKNRGIKDGDDLCAIAGMLCVSHLLGPNRGGALGWRSSGVGVDANGTSGTDYYNAGRYAIDVLSKGA
jgi:hypothetical protein